jgi:hypothetical protein
MVSSPFLSSSTNTSGTVPWTVTIALSASPVRRNFPETGVSRSNPLYAAVGKEWRAPSERIRTASEIPIEVDLTGEDATPAYLKISDKVLHLRRLGMTYARIAERIGVNVWMAKKGARWGNIQKA